MEIARHNLWQCIFIIQLYCSRFTPTTRLFLGSESMFHPVISVITALISWAMTDKHVKTLFFTHLLYCSPGMHCSSHTLCFQNNWRLLKQHSRIYLGYVFLSSFFLGWFEFWTLRLHRVHALLRKSIPACFLPITALHSADGSCFKRPDSIGPCEPHT